MAKNFSEMLSDLGFKSYDGYLKSPHWLTFKSRWRKANQKSGCAVCGGSKIQLHHHNYDNIGHERFGDVTPLCDLHHEEVHILLRDKLRPVSDTEWAIETIRRELGLIHDHPGRIPWHATKKQRKAIVAAIPISAEELARKAKEVTEILQRICEARRIDAEISRMMKIHKQEQQRIRQSKRPMPLSL
jgi:hypothetical protein